MSGVETELNGLERSLAEAARIISGGSRFIATAHARLDGDALGAMLVSAFGLRLLGKEVLLYNHELVPRRLLGLPEADKVVRRLQKGARFDATLVHDTGSRHLLGERFPGEEITGPLIILDHHARVSDFGAVVVRDAGAASAGVMSWRLLKRLGLSEKDMSRDLATALYASLVEDTGWFRYASTNREALVLAAACLDAGAEPWRLSLILDEQNSVASLRLLSLVLGTLELCAGGRVALLTLTDDLMSKAGATPDDVLKLANYARGLRGVEVGALLTHGDKEIYVSLRGKGSIDVAEVAARFGGGGHPSAAGCTLPITEDPTSIAAARARLLAALGEALDRDHAGRP